MVLHYKITFWRSIHYPNVSKYSDRSVWINSVDLDQEQSGQSLHSIAVPSASLLWYNHSVQMFQKTKFRLSDVFPDFYGNTDLFLFSQFSPDITPLILASQKNQYEIVQLLLLRGEKVQKPHKFGCLCQECVNKMKFDQLRSAKYRLNAYRGLASEAYISLSSKDPILTAFQLSKELRLLSRNEKYFKVHIFALVFPS